MENVWLVFTCGPDWADYPQLQGVFRTRDIAISFVRESLPKWQKGFSGHSLSSVTLCQHPLDVGMDSLDRDAPMWSGASTTMETTEWAQDWKPDELQRQFMLQKDEIGLCA